MEQPGSGKGTAPQLQRQRSRDRSATHPAAAGVPLSVLFLMLCLKQWCWRGTIASPRERRPLRSIGMAAGSKVLNSLHRLCHRNAVWGGGVAAVRAASAAAAGARLRVL